MTERKETDCLLRVWSRHLDREIISLVFPYCPLSRPPAAPSTCTQRDGGRDERLPWENRTFWTRPDGSGVKRSPELMYGQAGLEATGIPASESGDRNPPEQAG